MSQKKLTNWFNKSSSVKKRQVEENVSSAPTTSHDERSTQEPPKKKLKKFQNNWLSEFSWLRFDNKLNKIFCISCENFAKSSQNSSSSAFTLGSNNLQRSALVRHQKSDDHVVSCQAQKQKRYMDAAVKTVKKQYQPILEAQLRTAMYLATENIANRKFLSLIDLQISNAHVFTGSSQGPSKSNSFPGLYTNHQAASKMQACLANVLSEMAIVRMKGSPYIGIMVDESLDIATTKKLVMFAKIIHSGEIKLELCANVDIVDGKAETVYNAIVNWLANVGIDMSKVAGFGSDGASVMTGRKAGVAVKLKADNPRIIHIWCAAHRLALISYWAAKRVPYLASVQETLINIYNFYEFSAPRYNKIKELKKIMGGQVRKFKKPTQVRWLSLQDSIEAVHSSWSALVLGLEHETALNPGSEGGNKSKGILKKIKTFKFISTICLLRDILGWICRLSKFFQKDIIDVHQVDSMVAATKQTISVLNNVDESQSVQELIDSLDEAGSFQGIDLSCSLKDRLELANLRKSFVKNLLAEFDNRFPPDDMKILKAMNTILNPALLPQQHTSIADHGLEEIETVLGFYGTLFDRQEVTGSYLQFKFILNVNRHLSLQQMCMHIISEQAETFPGFAKMASLLMTVPLTSVPCERGFSSQNRHLAKFTSRRSVKNVEDRMVIEFASKQNNFNQDDVIMQAVQKMSA